MRGIALLYNIKTVIAVFHLLVEQECDNACPWHLLLTGRTHENYGEYRKKIEQQIKELNLCDWVTVRYDLSQLEMIKMIRAADVSVSLADHKGMPNSMFEC